VDFIDTADSYGPGDSEDIIREALHPYPKGLVIATKAGFTRQGPDLWSPVGRPEYLRQQVEMSLRRLGVERLDVFQLHRIDPKTPAADQFGFLSDLLKEGKVGAVGLSEVSVADIEAARRVVPIVSVQNRYNVSERQSEDVVRYCEENDIGFIPWFPIGSGALARPGGLLDEIAHETKATLPQVAIAWLLKRSKVILPIPGTSTVKHLEENCASGNVVLSDAQFKRLLDAVK
jgi:aryl-alcohol dehydrogenase-like predicted oxidoreductase